MICLCNRYVSDLFKFPDKNIHENNLFYNHLAYTNWKHFPGVVLGLLTVYSISALIWIKSKFQCTNFS
jgi:hypothetical protein